MATQGTSEIKVSDAESDSSTATAQSRVSWYRCRIPREELSYLNKRSDLLGFAQTLGYLGLLTATGVAAVVLVGRIPWPFIVLIVFFHGMCWNFMINAFHELVHYSVFKTQWLNTFFLRIVSFLGWYSHHHFWASHTEHHKYTLHPPDDLEVVLPQKYTLKGFWMRAIIHPIGFWETLKFHCRHAAGRVEGQWENHLFNVKKIVDRRTLRNWSRMVLAGQFLIVAGSVALAIWLKMPRLYMIPVVVTFAPFYAGGLHFLCNSSQHVGLKDNVADFRLCCRTIYLNPFVQFLYWHMNYHTEHHMYAAVPCYKLGRLHRIIKSEMPECPRGLYATWKGIAAILERQKTEPGWQFEAKLPPR